VSTQFVSSSVEILDEPRKRTWAEQALEGTRVGRDLAPVLRHLGRNLEVELHAVSAAAPAERLVGVDGRGGEEEGTWRQVEGISMPLECEELTRKSGEKRIANGCVGEEDRQEPDLGLVPGVDPAAEACHEELDAEAGAEERS